MSKNLGKGKVLLSGVRLSYANIFKPRSMQEDQAPKYSTSILISKTDAKTLAVIKQGIEEAKQSFAEKFGGGKVPANLKTPIRDGDVDRENDPNYAGHFFLNANANEEYRPTVLNETKQQATEDEVYSGCYVHITLQFYPFSISGNKGIAVGLGNIMKHKDGERLSGGVSAEEDFAEIEASELSLDDLI